MDFTIECDEKHGPVVRRAYTLQRSPLRILELHSFLQKVPNFLQDMGKVEQLTKLFDLNNSVVIIEGVGAAFLDCIDPGTCARIHCTFWDGRFRGRENLAREVINSWIYEYGLDFVYAEVKAERTALLAFSKRIGFIKVQEVNKTVLMQYLTPKLLSR